MKRPATSRLSCAVLADAFRPCQRTDMGEHHKESKAAQSGDLSVTALYTSAVWAWARLSCAEHFMSRDAKVVFRITNGILRVARLFVRGTTSLPHSLVHRHVLIDRLIESRQVSSIVELAAGLSRRGAAMSGSSAVEYVEFDRARVIEKKRALLSSTDSGRVILSRANYHLRAADVLQEPWEAQVDVGNVSVVVSEGLLMYLTPQERESLFHRVFRVLDPDEGEYLFDLVPQGEQPQPGVVGRVLGWLMRRFTEGKGFDEALVTREAIIAQLLQAGFQSVDVLEPSVVASEWNLPYSEIPTTQLVFRACCAPNCAVS